jgi:hypothetical protein
VVLDRYICRSKPLLIIKQPLVAFSAAREGMSFGAEKRRERKCMVLGKKGGAGLSAT